MGPRHGIETGEANRVITDCEKVVKSRVTVMVAVKLKERWSDSGWACDTWEEHQ